ncbi:MAG: ATP-dependent Clp protease ATP-binding subunit ClpA, partial [Pseudomonadota bacterium]
GKLAHGGEVHVSVKDEALAFELTPAPPKLVKRSTKPGDKKSPAPRRKPKAAPEPSGETD